MLKYVNINSCLPFTTCHWYMFVTETLIKAEGLSVFTVIYDLWCSPSILSEPWFHAKALIGQIA